MARSGSDLALLFLGSFRRLVDAAVLELADRGYPDVRPSHDFALRAVESGATSAADLARSLAVSKQAAAQTIAVLVERGYLARREDPADARRTLIRVTARGTRYLRTGEEVFDGLRRRLAAEIGPDALDLLESQLRTIVGDDPVRLDAPGWVAQGGR